MLTSVGESPANYLPPNKILIPFIVIVVESFFPPKVLPSGVNDEFGGTRWHTMKLFRPLLATTAAVMAAAYVPPHMELPAGWTDVASATVRSALRLSRLSVHRSDLPYLLFLEHLPRTAHPT